MDIENNSGVILCNEFSLYPKNTRAEVTLTQENITITNNTNNREEVISLKDVIGCHVLEGNKTTFAEYYLCIFYYPFKKKLFKGLSRVRCSKSLGITSKDSDELKRDLAVKWKKVIKTIITGNVVLKDQVDDLPDIKPRRLIVYVNPFSGQGKALNIYKDQVRGFFAEAEIKHHMIKTEYSGHAQEMAKELDVAKYDGIVIVSGDGLVHEVINGLMERQDWQTAIKTPIGIIPGGSGNALAAAIVYASTKQVTSNDLNLDSLIEIVSGRHRDLSLMKVQLSSKTFWSFLNVGWGFVADVDIESEKYRSLGGARFTVGCAVRVLNLRIYPGMISYLPTDESDNHYSQNIPKNVFKTESSHRDVIQSMIESEASSVLNSKNTGAQTFSGYVTESEHSETYKELRSNSKPPQMTGFTRRILSQEGNKDDVIVSSLSASSIDINSEDKNEFAPVFDLEPREHSNNDSYHLTNKLTESVPDQWLSFESDFVWVMPIHLSHAARDMFIMPPCKLGEDVIYLYCLKSGLTKSEITRTLLKIIDGAHLDIGGQNSIIIPCKAYRLEPFTKNSGLMTCDGELIPYEPLQATTTDIKARVFCSV